MLSKVNRAVLYALVLCVACALLLGVARPALAEEPTGGAGEGLEQVEGAPTVEGSGQDNNAVANDGVDVGQDNASDGNAAGQDVSVVTPTEGTTDASGNEGPSANDGPIASTSLDGTNGNNDAEEPRTTPTRLVSGTPLLGTGAEGEPSDENKPVTIDLSKSTDVSTHVDITPTGYSQGGDQVSYTGDYIITGTSVAFDTPLQFSNDGDKPVTYNVTFDNAHINASQWATAITFDGRSAVRLNLTVLGDNSISGSENHQAFRYRIQGTEGGICISLEGGATLKLGMSGAYSAYNSTFTWTSDCDCYDATAVPSGFNGTIKHNMGADSFKGFTWTGNDTDGYTAAVGSYECSGSAKAKISVDAKLESADTSTCTVDGTVTYTATIAKADSPDGIEHTEDKTISGKATGHDWGKPTYTWADDNSSVTATRVCKKDETHVETETESTTSEVTKKATCTAKGETTYTVTFTNAAFSTQTKIVEDVDIDPDAHDWQAAKGASNEDIEECSHCHERRRDESSVNLDLSKSSHRDKRLTITPTGYVQDDGEEIAYTGAYILTGGITANTPLVFSNNTGEAYTFDVTFDNVTIGSGTYETTIVLTGSSDIQLDLKVVGDNTITGATNHTAFKRYWAPTNKVTINISLEEDATLTITKSTAGTYSDLTWISDCSCYDATAVPGAFTGTIRHRPPFKGFTWTGDDESGYTAAVGHFECNVVSRDVDATVTSEDTPATCTEDGVTTYTATIAKADSPDGYAHTETKTVTSKAKGHDWGAWTVTREATEDEEGEETRTCKRCGEAEKRAIPKVTYYDITYVLAGGNVDGNAGPIVERHAGGEQIAIMKEPTREGYTFQYWEGSRYNPGDAYTVVEDHTFTAVWQKDAEPEPKPDDKPSGKVVPKTGGDVAPARSALPETGDVTSNQIAVLFGAAGAALITAASLRKREE